MPGGYAFNGNPEDIFKEFFGAGTGAGGFADLFAQAAMNGGSGSPFVFQMGGGGPRFARGGGRPGAAGRQGGQQGPREMALQCTLEELYRGARKVAQCNGASFDIEVKPGWKAGTKISYPGGSAFVVQEDKHSAFSRQGNDLSYWAEVSLGQLLTGSRQRIKALDGRFIPVEFAPLTLWTVRAAKQSRGRARPALPRPGWTVVSPRLTPRARRASASAPLRCCAQEVHNEGMPISKSVGRKGKLTVYASPLSPHQLATLKSWGTIAMCAPAPRSAPRGRASAGEGEGVRVQGGTAAQNELAAPRPPAHALPARVRVCAALCVGRYLGGFYIFMNYSSLLIPAVMLYQLARAAG